MLATANSPDPGILAAKARAFLSQGRPGAARPIVAALRAVGGDAALTAELEARLLLAQGRAAEGIAELGRALDQLGPSSALHATRAELHLLAGNLVGAAADSAEAVVLDAGCPAAKAILGHALLRLGRPADAVACLDEALRATPNAVATRLDLVMALDAIAAPELGDAVIAGGIALAPRDAGLRNAAVLRSIRAGNLASALATALDARRDGLLDACGFGLLGHTLSSLGRHDEAADAYVEALKLAPDDPYVRHLVAAAGRFEAGERAPPEYVRVLFDGYAERFDRHLIHLRYRVPGLIRSVLARGAVALGPVLDLGCGTGLLAVACQDVACGAWTGVDLSSRMLAAAREKGLYSELHEADLIAYLADEGRTFPLILAGDVLCYFGPLAPILAAVQPRLTPNGQFVLTVERLACESDAVHLGRMGRYAHSEAHLRSAAESTGLRIVSLDQEALRHDGETPVQGFVAVLGRAA